MECVGVSLFILPPDNVVHSMFPFGKQQDLRKIIFFLILLSSFFLPWMNRGFQLAHAMIQC